jgi:hypothetical protein
VQWLWAAATTGRQLPAGQLQQLLAVFVSQLHQATPQGVCSALWAGATIGQQVPAGQLQQLLDVLVGQLQQATPKVVSNTLWAVAAMGQQVPAGQLQQLLDAFVPKLQQANTTGCVNHTVGMCQAGLPFAVAAGSIWAGRAAGSRHPSNFGQLAVQPGLVASLAAGMSSSWQHCWQRCSCG